MQILHCSCLPTFVTNTSQSLVHCICTSQTQSDVTFCECCGILPLLIVSKSHQELGQRLLEREVSSALGANCACLRAVPACLQGLFKGSQVGPRGVSEIQDGSGLSDNSVSGVAKQADTDPFAAKNCSGQLHGAEARTVRMLMRDSHEDTSVAWPGDQKMHRHLRTCRYEMVRTTLLLHNTSPCRKIVRMAGRALISTILVALNADTLLPRLHICLVQSPSKHRHIN